MASDGRSIIRTNCGETTVTVGGSILPAAGHAQWPGWSSGRGGNCWW
ncbi:hypothetical protein RRG08_064247, partial [Elysia crispata]